MSQSVNLIPQQEISQQNKVKALRLSTVFTIILLIGVGSTSLYYFNIKRDLVKQKEATEAEINRLRGEIGSLSQIEINARNLFQKFTVLNSLFTNRTYFSLLTKELNVRRPENVLIDSMSMQKTNELDVSGTANNYITIASYMNNLLNTDFEGGDPALKGLFTSVSLTSVRLEQERGTVKFSIVVQFNESKLKK